MPNVDSAEGRVFGSYWHGLELPRHLFHFSPESLKLLAESARLQEVSLETRRNPAVGTSLRYVWDDLFRSVGHQAETRCLSGRTEPAVEGDAQVGPYDNSAWHLWRWPPLPDRASRSMRSSVSQTSPIE